MVIWKKRTGGARVVSPLRLIGRRGKRAKIEGRI